MTSGLLPKLVDHEFLLLGWPKSSSRFSCNIRQKHPNELYGQPKRIRAFHGKRVHHYLLPATGLGRAVSGEGISDLERVLAFSLRPPSSALPCHPLCLQPEGHRHSEKALTGLAQLQRGDRGAGLPVPPSLARTWAPAQISDLESAQLALVAWCRLNQELALCPCSCSQAICQN